MSTITQTKPKPTFLPLQARFPFSSPQELLTSFVQSPSRPKDAFAPSKPPKHLFNPEDSYIVKEQSFEAFCEDNRIISGKVCAIDASGQRVQIYLIKAKKITTWRLSQHIALFNRVLSVDDVKDEVLDLMDRTSNHKLYMVVGFMTCSNATFGVETLTRRTTSGAANVSLQAIMPTGQGLSIGAKNKNDAKFLQTQEAADDQELVFAIEYKILRDKRNFPSKRGRPNMGHLRLSTKVVNCNPGLFEGDEGEEVGWDEDLELLNEGLGEEEIGWGENILLA